MNFWTEREDRIVESKLDYPSLTVAELQTALRSIGSTRTVKGITTRVKVLREQRARAAVAQQMDEMTRLRAWWLAAPWRRTA